VDINNISIYLASKNAQSLACLVSQILEREFTVSNSSSAEISLDLGHCTFKIFSDLALQEKVLPIDLKLGSAEQFNQLEQKIEFYNFCDKRAEPAYYEKVSDNWAKLTDFDGRIWNFYL
jgi:hypothetical protein